MVTCDNNPFDLSNEMVEYVFKFLPPKELSISASVCTLWRSLAHHEPLWKNFVEKDQQIHGLKNRKIFINQMKIKNSDFYKNSYYFNKKGFIRPIEVRSLNEFNPNPVKFILKNNSITSLFLIDNPWRKRQNGSHSGKVYQFCLFCKTKRFEDKTFHGNENEFALVTNATRPGGKETLPTCRKITCQGKNWFDLANNLASNKIHALIYLHHMQHLPKFIAQDQNKITVFFRNFLLLSAGHVSVDSSLHELPVEIIHSIGELSFRS